jgi:hypothetical protein
MSLHSFVHGKAEVRQGFGARLLRPQAKLERGLQAPPLTTNYEMVKAAFDYLLGFLLERWNPQARAPQWTAERAVELIRQGEGGPARPEITTLSGHSRTLKAAAYLADAKRQHHAYMQVGRITDSLMLAAHRLAHLDVAVRAGADRVDWKSINYLSPDDGRDLKALLALVDEKTFRTPRACILKPVLGAAAVVGGAEVDCIVGDCLVGVTMTKDQRVDVREYYALVAAWLLLGLGGIRRADGSAEQLPVAAVGIYFSRFGQLWKVPIEGIMPAKAVPGVTRWFVETACAENEGAREALAGLNGPLAAFVR